MKRTIIALALALLTSSAYAEDPTRVHSADYLIPGCRLGTNMRNYNDFFARGLCIGTLNGVWSTLMRIGIVCTPANVTTGQVVRVVVRYIDDRPEKLNELFTDLASAALLTAWPCDPTRTNFK
jgi:hypothetical protein